MELLDKSLLEKLVEMDEETQLFANSTTLAGEFFLEGLDIYVSVTDEEMDEIFSAQNILFEQKQGINSYSTTEIEKAEKLYLPFMQVHNHELVHLMQVLSLPALKVCWATRTTYLRFEATVMLRFFELGYSYTIGEHKKPIQALENDEFVAKSELDGDAQGILADYIFYSDCWKAELEGISLFHIIEGMAHIASIQLSDYENVDALGFENNPVYNTAFTYFSQQISDQELETRWKYLLFLYFCYFSCQHFNDTESEDGLTPVRIFLNFCAQIEKYIIKLKSFFATHAHTTKAELLQSLRWNFEAIDLEKANQKQVAAVTAFYELIEFIEAEGYSKGDRSSVKTSKLDDFLIVSNKMNFDWQDSFMLADMMIFPKKFVQIRELYDTVMGLSVGENEYSYSQEATFYKFVVNCKNLFKQNTRIPCCELHGFLEDHRKILNCKEEGGLSFYLEALTNRPASELFKIWRPLI